MNEEKIWDDFFHSDAIETETTQEDWDDFFKDWDVPEGTTYPVDKTWD